MYSLFIAGFCAVLHFSYSNSLRHESKYIVYFSPINTMSDILCFSSALSLAPPTVRIVHSGHACNVEEERYTERVYTIREGETLELTCLVTGHPRPQVSHLYLPTTSYSAVRAASIIKK